MALSNRPCASFEISVYKFGVSEIVIGLIYSCDSIFLPILFSKIFFKKSIVVAGGTDCVSFPSIGYGNFSNKFAISI